MTEAINFAVAILTLASAILAALYDFARDVSPRPQQSLSSASPIERQIKNPRPAQGTTKIPRAKFSRQD